MGGCCCCASGSAEENSLPAPEEHGHLPSQHASVSSLSTGLLVDTNLDTSVPDTYRPPPTPIPYESYASNPPTSSANKQRPEGQNNEAATQTTIAPSLENPTPNPVKNSESAKEVETNVDLEIEDENSDDLKKPAKPFGALPIEEEDGCPICLEEYDEENPKLITKCDHDFHLACILEWMERSNACPVCDQQVELSPLGEA